jgi:hypothetical protein
MKSPLSLSTYHYLSLFHRLLNTFTWSIHVKIMIPS